MAETAFYTMLSMAYVKPKTEDRASDRLGTWIDADTRHRCPPPSRRLVQQTPTDLQRRHRRRPPRLVVATEFFHVPVELRKHRNSGHLVKSIRGDSMSRRLKCGKSS